MNRKEYSNGTNQNAPEDDEEQMNEQRGTFVCEKLNELNGGMFKNEQKLFGQVFCCLYETKTETCPAPMQTQRRHV